MKRSATSPPAVLISLIVKRKISPKVIISKVSAGRSVIRSGESRASGSRAPAHDAKSPTLLLSGSAIR